MGDTWETSGGQGGDERQVGDKWETRTNHGGTGRQGGIPDKIMMEQGMFLARIENPHLAVWGPTEKIVKLIITTITHTLNVQHYIFPSGYKLSITGY